MEEKVLMVKKRDGKTQVFDINKIIKAFTNVYRKGLKKEVNENIKEKLIDTINKKYVNNKKITEPIDVEDIQDTIRDLLMRWDTEAAENFVLYRDERSNYREANTKLSKAIRTKLSAKAVQNQNANLDEESFSGRVGEAASAVCRDYALKNSMSKMARKNHENNYIYQHDLDQFAIGMHNCLSEPLDDVLGNGIVTRQTDIRPASSLNTAFQLTAVNFQLQSLMQFGGISATHLDWTMVPFFRISFFKNYINGLKYVEGWDDNKINEFTKQFGIEYKSEDLTNVENLNENLNEKLSDKTVWEKFMGLLKK